MPDEAQPQDPEQTQDTQGQPSAPQAAEPGHAPSAGETPEIPAGYIPEERYTNLQADHTRAAQEAAQYRQLVEAAQQGDPEALQALGLDLVEDGPETPAAPDEPFLTREEWDQYQAERQAEEAHAELQAQSQEQQQATFSHIEQGLAQIEQRIGRKLDEVEVEFIAPRAIAQPGQDGQPDVEAAFKRYEEWQDAQQKRYVATKQAPRVPDGQSATSAAPDLSTSEGRNAFGEQRLRELQEQQFA